LSSYQIRKAAKYYTCADSGYAHDRMIAPGDKYVRITLFKSDLFVDSSKPRQVVLCLACGHIAFPTSTTGEIQ
jgi:hypothetical protein